MENTSAVAVPPAASLQASVSPAASLVYDVEGDVSRKFNLVDTNKDGEIDKKELSHYLKMSKLPHSSAHIDELFAAVDKDRNGRISQQELKLFLNKQYAKLKGIFEELDENKNGTLDLEEVKTALTRLQIEFDEEEVAKLMRRIDTDQSGTVDFREWMELLAMAPRSTIEKALKYWKEAAALDVDEGFAMPMKAQGYEAWMHLGVGAFAGAVSKTAVAPLERLKIIFQLNKTRPPSLLQGLKNIYAEGGWRAFYVGNGVNVLKIAPESAVKFFVFDKVKRMLGDGHRDLAAAEIFLAGALAGVAAHLSFFPLDVIKTRITAAPKGTYHGIADLVRQIQKQEGMIRPFYRGLSASIASTIPHSGINLMSYEMAKSAVLSLAGATEPTTAHLMIASSCSSAATQVFFYPLHVVKSRLIMQGKGGEVKQYSGLLDCFAKTVKAEGFYGLFKGFLPSFLKSVPSHMVTYTMYDVLKKTLGIQKQKKHH